MQETWGHNRLLRYFGSCSVAFFFSVWTPIFDSFAVGCEILTRKCGHVNVASYSHVLDPCSSVNLLSYNFFTLLP